MTRLTGIVAATALLIAAGAALGQPADLNWVDWDLVDSGEIALQTGKVEKGTTSIDLAIAIDADRDAIWNLLTACEISPEYVPHVVACRQIAALEDCDCEFFEQIVKPAFFLPRFEHVFELAYFPPDRIEVSHISGPIDVMEGSWQLIQRPGKPIVLVYSLVLKPGFPVPPMFVRNTLRRDLPTVLLEVRARAEKASNP